MKFLNEFFSKITMRMEISNSMDSLLTNLIPLKNLKLAKISSLKVMFKKLYLSQYLMDVNK